MKSWHFKPMGSSLTSFASALALEKSFFALYTSFGPDVGAAVLTKYDSDLDIVTAYFTPDANALALESHALVCAPPTMEGLGVLLGDARILDHYFPKAESSELSNRTIARSKAPLT